MGAFCVLLSLATGVDYGWQPAADGSLTYLIQVEPELVDELSQPGFAIESVIPDDLRGVRRFKIYVGRGPVPRVGSPHAAVQAQWSQYVEPAGASGTQYLNQAVPPNDPYGVVNGYLPPALQTPVWSDQAVTKDSLYSWSQLGQDYLGGASATNAGADAPPLTFPPDFQQGIAALPEQVTAPLGNAWNQATQTLAERGLDPRQILPQAEDRIKQEWNSGVAGAEAALDRFGNQMAEQANRTVGAWTGTEITRSPNPAAPASPVGTRGGAFAAAPPVSQPAAAPPTNFGAAAPGGLGIPAGPSFAAPATNANDFGAAPRDFASAPAFNTAPAANVPPLGTSAPPLGGAFPNNGLGGSPLAGGPLPGGNSLDGTGLGGGSSLDSPPLAGSGLGSAPPLGGSLDGGSLGGGSSLGSGPGAGVGGSLGGPPSSGLGSGGLGSDLGGSLGGGGGGLGGGPGSLAGGGSSLGGNGSLGGGSLGGGSLGGSLGGPSTLPGDQPFGVPQIGGSRPDDDNPFGVPIVARTEVAKDRRTLPYAAVPIRPDFSSDLLDGPSTLEVTQAGGPGSAHAWNWGGSFDQNGRPWGPLFLTAVILFLSVGLNCYLAWISRGLYERYKNLVFSRRHSSTTAAI